MARTYTPMMEQYRATKEKYKDCILFFRLGDFYEMFFDDATLAAKELEITLTARNCGNDEKAPMCGVPYHAADQYIARLIEKGYKVAICEQTQNPKDAVGIVERDVVRVITPGTVLDSQLLDEKSNRYIMCIYKEGLCYGIGVADTGTGEFQTTQIVLGATDEKVLHEIAKYRPAEIVWNEVAKNELEKSLDSIAPIYVTTLDDELFETKQAIGRLSEQFETLSRDFLQAHIGANASGALLLYLDRMQKVFPMNMDQLDIYEYEAYMEMDAVARRNLELTQTLYDRRTQGSLLWVMDRTVTAMGGRLLKNKLEKPLTDVPSICEHLDAVEFFHDHFMQRAEISELLSSVYDMERILGKAVIGSLNAKDLLSLKASLERLPLIQEVIEDVQDPFIAGICKTLDTMDDLYDELDRAVVEQPANTITEGGLIKKGYHPTVDELKDVSENGHRRIEEYQKKERERTSIKNLKVGYNKVFGYYIEVTRSNLAAVPDEYVRKQTLANCERYITDELKEIEELILGAKDRLVELEYEIFLQLRTMVTDQAKRLKTSAKMVATLDVLCALAETADRERYVKPKVHDKEGILIEQGRHPVVEKMMTQTPFVPNDTTMDTCDNRMSIITGPNMAGKSTYMRQVALIVIMAQMGGFVPADSATIGICDKIFTRIGASDRLGSGQSTFMVEMVEVAHILKNATAKSLLILDEVGRGTSTYDGLSLAWAVIEHISKPEILGCRTLFATHYHELTELETKMQGIKNYRITAKKKDDQIIFLRKIERGGADESYGVQVARLAGVSDSIISRAKEILFDLENADIAKKRSQRKKTTQPITGQIDITQYNMRTKNNESILNSLKEMDVQKMTPLDALNRLYELSEKAKQT